MWCRMAKPEDITIQIKVDGRKVAETMQRTTDQMNELNLKLSDRYGGLSLIQAGPYAKGMTFCDKDGAWVIVHYDHKRHMCTIERDRPFFSGHLRVVTAEYIYRWRKFLWEMDQRRGRVVAG